MDSNLIIPVNSKIFKESTLSFDVGFNLIYGYNNSGKTTLLAIIDTYCDELINNSLGGKKFSMVIPTNRVLRDNGDYNEWVLFEEYEFKLYKKRRVSQYVIDNGILMFTDVDYRSHLTNIRGQLFSNKYIKQFIFDIIFKLFKIEYDDKKRYSDGIENVVNLYLNIIWLSLISTKIDNMYVINNSNINSIFEKAKIIILIDEVEEYLHNSIIPNLIVYIEQTFKNATFILTTHSPLVLSRINAKYKYRLYENGIIKEDNDNKFYMSVEKINEIDFDVAPWPDKITQAMQNIENFVLNENVIKKNEICENIKLIEQYKNIAEEYNDLIIYAKSIIGEKYDNIE